MNPDFAKNKGISNARFLLGRLRTTIKNKNRSSKDVLIPVRITGFDGWTDELILFESNTSSMQINILFRNRCNQIDTSMTFDICHTCDSPWTINERHCWHIVVPHSILYLHAQFSLRLIFKSFFLFSIERNLQWAELQQPIKWVNKSGNIKDYDFSRIRTNWFIRTYRALRFGLGNHAPDWDIVIFSRGQGYYQGVLVSSFLSKVPNFSSIISTLRHF